MSPLERNITLGSLFLLALFYVMTLTIYLVARKDPLNKALAAQKTLWLAIVTGIAIPAYAQIDYVLPSPIRVALWLCLDVTTLWVMREVYHANWHGTFWEFIRHVPKVARSIASKAECQVSNFVGRKRERC